jgi:hypothetical protein
MLRDIDYAALTVRKQIDEKFGRQKDLAQLEVRADEKTIAVIDGDYYTAGTRDALLAALRDAKTYDEFFEAAR